jgi:hypothetical protein
MAKHTETSWKPDKPVNQLYNSVGKATNAVEQAASHPSQQLVQQSQNALDRAENGVIDALESHGNQGAIQQLQDQLNEDRELLQQAQQALPTEDEQ